MKRPQTFRRSTESGTVLLILAASTITLLACAGLALDLGYMEYWRRRVQIAADSGALGGAREYQANGGASVVTAATGDVTSNGFTNSVNGATVTVSYPPATGPHAGNAKYVEVVVAKQVPVTFMRALKLTAMTVRARSVGGFGDSQYCVLALDPSAPKALSVSGSTAVTMPGCEVMVDSNASDAFYNGNTSSCMTAKEIDVVGGGSGNACTTPPPTNGADRVLDPFATLAAPSYSGCDQTNYNVNSNNQTINLTPGVYCGGLKISGNNNTINFAAGIYILNGGGIDHTGGGGNILNGTGVTFYNTGTSSNGINKFADIKLNGSSTVHLSAPTSGTYEGILFFQDRTIADQNPGDPASGNANIITGNTGGANPSYFDGVLYFPKGDVAFSGNSSTNGYTDIVARTVTFTGSSNLKNDYTSLSSGSPIKGGSLTE